MSDVTDADREKAKALMGWAGVADRYLTGIEIAEQKAIAAALAEEREKARAPFLALLDEEPNVQPLWEFERGVLRGIEMCKTAIRRRAEDTP